MTTLEPGCRLNNYILTRRVGRGSFGEVWMAHHHVWADQLVAIKVPTDDAYVRTLQKEGMVVHGLSHPNIVRVLDLDPFAPTPYMVMELVSGQSLREVLNEKGPLPLVTAADYLEQILDGLAAAHAAGIVHRDIKPANILISNAGVAKLTDFGLGRVSTATVSGTNSLLMSGAAGSLEGRGVSGTLAYMAPEQQDPSREGAIVTAASDIYAVGIVWFEMLTGIRPQGMDLPSDLVAGLPAWTDELFRRSYTRLERRYASAAEMLAAVRSARQVVSPAPDHALAAQPQILNQSPTDQTPRLTAVPLTPSDPTPQAGRGSSQTQTPPSADSYGPDNDPLDGDVLIITESDTPPETNPRAGRWPVPSTLVRPSQRLAPPGLPPSSRPGANAPEVLFLDESGSQSPLPDPTSRMSWSSPQPASRPDGIPSGPLSRPPVAARHAPPEALKTGAPRLADTTNSVSMSSLPHGLPRRERPAPPAGSSPPQPLWSRASSPEVVFVDDNSPSPLRQVLRDSQHQTSPITSQVSGPAQTSPAGLPYRRAGTGITEVIWLGQSTPDGQPPRREMPPSSNLPTSLGLNSRDRSLQRRAVPAAAGSTAVPQDAPRRACPSCSALIAPGHNFCLRCGRQVVGQVRRCSSCGRYPEPAEVYCDQCGQQLPRLSG